MNPPDLSNVLGSPLQTPTGHGADRPEREHLVEPVVDILYIICEGRPEGQTMLEAMHSSAELVCETWKVEYRDKGYRATSSASRAHSRCSTTGRTTCIRFILCDTDAT